MALDMLCLSAGYLLAWLAPPTAPRYGAMAAWPAYCFVSGLSAIFLALASPIEPFAVLLLQVHMVQHLLLTMVAPPLLWLGSPLIPMLRGLPGPVRVYWVAPLLRRE